MLLTVSKLALPPPRARRPLALQLPVLPLVTARCFSFPPFPYVFLFLLLLQSHNYLLYAPTTISTRLNLSSFPFSPLNNSPIFIYFLALSFSPSLILFPPLPSPDNSALIYLFTLYIDAICIKHKRKIKRKKEIKKKRKKKKRKKENNH